MQAALDSLKTELARLDDRRGLLCTAITSLEQLLGAAPAPATVPARPDVSPRDPVGASRLDALVRAERKAASGVRGDEARVVELLEGRGRMAPKEIARTLEMTTATCKWVLTKLRGKGLIETEGATNRCVVQLKMAKSPQVAATPRADEGLEVAWNGAMKRSPEDVLREQRGEVRS